MDNATTGRVLAVVPAAGSGTRLGLGPKAFVQLEGETLLARAVAGLDAAGVDEIVVAVAADMLDAAREVLATSAVCAGIRAAVQVCVGGAERTDSVRRGLAAADSVDVDVLLVHDAARCLTPAPMIRGVVQAVRDGARAVIPVLPVTDTIKHVAADGVVDGTPDRSRLRAVQTPQGFDPDTLRAAYDAGGDIATDDAGLVERLGVAVHTVPGHAQALKITTPIDLDLARIYLDRAAAETNRGAGTNIDDEEKQL